MKNNNISVDDLMAYIEKVERLELEKKDILAAIKEVYDEASGNGFDPKIMRQIVRLRKMDKDSFKENEVLLAVYKKAMGMLIVIDEFV